MGPKTLAHLSKEIEVKAEIKRLKKKCQDMEIVEKKMEPQREFYFEKLVKVSGSRYQLQQKV